MAVKTPVVITGGEQEQLQTGNSINIGDGIIDYFATSTKVGFGSFATSVLQYLPMGKFSLVIFDIQTNAAGGVGTTTTVTLPFNAAITQYGIYHSLNNGTTQSASVWRIVAGSNILEFSTTSSITNVAGWITATTRGVQGNLIYYHT